MQKARSHPSEERLLPLVGTRFQVLFHSPSGVLFTFPSRYCFTIGHGRVFSLGGWSPQFPTGFLVSRRTQVPELISEISLSPTGLSPSAADPSRSLRLDPSRRRATAPSGPYNPGVTSTPVWAPPLSLAATRGISFDFFSWSYLDVSVRSVGLQWAMYSPTDDGP
jgi:hypothetical protein